MIKETDTSTGKVTETFVGRVLAVTSGMAMRNCSDTLDYSDWQTVQVTTARVYYGRTVPADQPHSMYLDGWTGAPGAEIPIEKRFGYVDCTNLFAWRCSVTKHATVDEGAEKDPEIAEDLAAFDVILAERSRLAAIAAAKQAVIDAERKAARERAAIEAEKNRPRVGMKMVVAKGRKVAVGTVGVVAYIHRDTGSVLLKDERCWQDRKANGVWVNPSHLKVAS